MNLTVTANGVSLSLSWQPPAGDQTIVSYTVSCLVAGVVKVHAQLKPTLGITLNQLTPSTEYSCTVCASSSGGAGPTTESVVTSTESGLFVFKRVLHMSINLICILIDVTINDIYLTFIPMDTTYGVDEVFLAESDEGTSDAIPISINFPFGQSNQDQFYVIHIVTLFDILCITNLLFF